MMGQYTSVCDEEETPDGLPFPGNEFCDLLATILSCRLYGAFDEAGLLEDGTIDQAISDLCNVFRAQKDGGDWMPTKLHPAQKALLKKTGLPAQYEGTAKRPPGRPHKGS